MNVCHTLFVSHVLLLHRMYLAPHAARWVCRSACITSYVSVWITPPWFQVAPLESFALLPVNLPPVITARQVSTNGSTHAIYNANSSNMPTTTQPIELLSCLQHTSQPLLSWQMHQRILAPTFQECSALDHDHDPIQKFAPRSFVQFMHQRQSPRVIMARERSSLRTHSVSQILITCCAH